MRQEGGPVVIDVGHHDLHLDLVKFLEIQQKQNEKHFNFFGRICRITIVQQVAL